MSDEEELYFIERGEDGEVKPYKWNRAMHFFLWNKKGHIKEDIHNNKKNNKNKKE